MHAKILVAVVASCAMGASAFAPTAPMRLKHAGVRAAPAMGLRMQLDTSKVTFGLAEPYLKDIPEAKQVFAYLQATDYSPLSADQDKQAKEALSSAGKAILSAAENDGKYLGGDVVSTFVYTKVMLNGGFSDFAEKVNGRVAMMAFPYVLLQTFEGNLLELLSSYWFSATALTWLIIVGSTFTTPASKDISGAPAQVVLDSLPADVKTSYEDAVKQIETIFTPTAELTNGRASMAAMGVWIITALLFHAE